MNPFRDAIVATPWNETRADVASIHGEVFDACLRGIETVRANHRSAAILIHGEAGSGKTHLLSRLRSHLAPQLATATDRAEYLYVWVRLQTSPRMIWRTLRRTLVDDWFRPIRGHRSQFERILFHRLADIRVAEGDLEPWYEFMLDEHPAGLQELLEKIAESLDLDRNTAVAFEHIAFGRHRRDLRAWLAGDSLPEAALETINLTSDEGTDEEHESRARQVVLMLCRLAGNGLPIVLSFDQVEALQVSPRDHDGPFAFGQMVSTLHDGTENVLLISCIQSAFVTELADKVRGADYARMTSLGTLSLHSLNRAQAEQLIAARLQSAEPEVPTEESRSASWPLDADQFSNLFQKGDLTPRQLLGLCADRYETYLTGAIATKPDSIAPPIDHETTSEATATHAAGTEFGATETTTVDTAEGIIDSRQRIAEFLDLKWNSTLEEKVAVNSPDQTEEIVRHGLPLLVRLIHPQQESVKIENLLEVPLVFQGPGGFTGLSIRAESNMGSLGAKFGRLAQDFESGKFQRLVMIRDQRRPITKTAKAAQKKFDDLQQAGVIVLEPTAEILAALDTLRDLLSDAKSGDLDCEGTTISATDVEAWLVTREFEKLRQFVATIFQVQETAPSK